MTGGNNMRNLLSGNEAIALGFYEANGIFASGYPGTPSTEIMESISNYSNIYSEWAPNEKVALESTIGSSYAGARSMAVMKHVGVNVASDALFTLAYTGCNAGLIIISTDDVGIHSSQNEQDNRWYSKFSKIPMLEPSDSQECFDFVKIAFEISEKFQSPIFIRLTTRISHSKSIVKRTYKRGQSDTILPIDFNKRFNPIPSISRELHYILENKILQMENYVENLSINVIEETQNSDLCIITSGICYQYVKEAFDNKYSILKLGMIYPLPKKLIKSFCQRYKKVYIFEELDDFIESQISTLGINCIGKVLTPKLYELTPSIIKSIIMGLNELPPLPIKTSLQEEATFCPGCSYRAFFYVLKKFKNIIISSDIGCYSIGEEKSFKTKDISICMGGGFSIAHGIQKVFQIQNSQMKSIGIMGDSTFFHSGMTSLLTNIYNKSNSLLIILDNHSTSMTGLQDNPGTGITLSNEKTTAIDIKKVVNALGVKHIRCFNPLNLKETELTLKWGLSLNETAVLIAQCVCSLKTERKSNLVVDYNTCINCKKCLLIKCPALTFNEDINTIIINQYLCNGCSVCKQLCDYKAIKESE